jgi:hypothetical protein
LEGCRVPPHPAAFVFSGPQNAAGPHLLAKLADHHAGHARRNLIGDLRAGMLSDVPEPGPRT